MDSDTAVFFVVAVVGAAFFLPTIVALGRDFNVGSTFVLNLFLGLTGFGWFLALANALAPRPVHPVVQYQYVYIEAPVPPNPTPYPDALNAWSAPVAGQNWS